MSDAVHAHVVQRCAVHGHRLGGCRCFRISDREELRTELVDCAPHCPAVQSREEPVIWDRYEAEAGG